MGIKKAKTKEIKRSTAADLGVAATPTVVIEKVYVAAAHQADADLRRRRQEAAAKLVEKLKFEVRVI